MLYLIIIAYNFAKVKRENGIFKKTFSIFIDEKIYSVDRQMITTKKGVIKADELTHSEVWQNREKKVR